MTQSYETWRTVLWHESTLWIHFFRYPDIHNYAQQELIKFVLFDRVINFTKHVPSLGIYYEKTKSFRGKQFDALYFGMIQYCR